MGGAVGGLEAKAQFRESGITSGEKTARNSWLKPDEKGRFRQIITTNLNAAACRRVMIPFSGYGSIRNPLPF